MESGATPPVAPSLMVQEAENVEAVSAPRSYRWTRAEYERLARLGIFLGRRVERVNGEIIEMSPMGDRHRAGVTIAGDELREAFGKGYFISAQNSCAIGEDSDPEPDILVVQGRSRDFITVPITPEAVVLVVEVSDTTLGYDRNYKASLYASAGLQDYWILCVQEKRRFLEVRRRPRPDVTEPGGWAYSETTVYGQGDTVSPLARPDIVLRVDDLLL